MMRTPSLMAAAALLAAGSAGAGSAPEVIAEAPASTLLAEGVAWDSLGGRYLISGVQGLMTVGPDGGLRLVARADPAAWAMQGIAFAPDRRTLWAVISANRHVPGAPADEKGAAALVRMDPATGETTARFPLPGRDQDYADLAVAPDGTVYVGHPYSGEIYRLRPGAPDIELWLRKGPIKSVQGMAVSPDGRRMIVADYITGLAVVDLATAAVSPLAAPEGLDLSGVDGVMLSGRDLVVIRNGSSPFRVIALVLDAAMTRIESGRVVVDGMPAGEPALEPTLGVIADGDVVLVAHAMQPSPSPGPAGFIGRSLILRSPLKSR